MPIMKDLVKDKHTTQVIEKNTFIGPLSVWIHSPKIKAKSRFIIIHGIGEHSGRHLNTINSLLSQGVEVVRFDLRGAGESGGERQWIDKWYDYVEDTASVFNWICSTLKPLPLYVLGHSMGGTIAVYFASDYQTQLKGLVLTAPAFLLGESISTIKLTIGRALEKVVPHLRLPKSLSSSTISRITEVVRAYDEDSLCCHYNTLRQGAQLLWAVENLPHHARQLRLPVLIFHGSNDRIVNASGSFEILKMLPSHDKILHILPGGYHEPHNDLNPEHYFSLLDLWIKRVSNKD